MIRLSSPNFGKLLLRHTPSIVYTTIAQPLFSISSTCSLQMNLHMTKAILYYFSTHRSKYVF
jgi:hypothetical protein